MKVPEHTVATRRQRGATERSQPRSCSSAAAALAPLPPATTSVSMRRPGSGSAPVFSSSPLSARTGPPLLDTTLIR